MEQATPKRAYLFEVDLVRSVTALCVVGVHVLAFTLFLNQTALGAQLQNAMVATLHFTREVFLTITAFVLVYTYINKPFQTKGFWRKRGLGVLLPYVIWSIIYTWISLPHQPVGHWLWQTFLATLTGSASYQLYYILLSLEFYLILPWFLPTLNRFGRHPWRLLIGSFAIQVVLLYLDHHYLEGSPLGATFLGQQLLVVQARLLPFYQFWIVLGALGALYLTQVRAFVVRHGRWIVLGTVVGLGLLWLRYFLAVWVEHQSTAYATEVFQPSMVPYAAAVALFLYWLGVTWAGAQPGAQPTHGRRAWSLLSDASFGIYLVHPLILDAALLTVVPGLPTAWPVALRVGITWLLVAGGAVAVSALLLYLPGFSRLVGRPSALPPNAMPVRWIASVRNALRARSRQQPRGTGRTRTAARSRGLREVR